MQTTAWRVKGQIPINCMAEQPIDVGKKEDPSAAPTGVFDWSVEVRGSFRRQYATFAAPSVVGWRLCRTRAVKMTRAGSQPWSV